MNGPDSWQRTTRFTGRELRLVERAARRHGYRSLPEFLHDAALHYSAHRASITRPRLAQGNKSTKEAPAGPASIDAAPEGLAGQSPQSRQPRRQSGSCAVFRNDCQHEGGAAS